MATTKSAALEAVRAWGSGGFVLCCTAADGRLRGDLAQAAEFADVDSIGTMLTVARGLLCLALDGPSFDRLGLTVTDHRGAWSNPRAPVASATVGVVGRDWQGASAGELAMAVVAALGREPGASRLCEPGRLPVLRAAEGGLAERSTPTEAAIELCRRAGTAPGAVLAEVLDDLGELGDAPYLANLARLLRIPVLRIDDLRMTTATGQAACGTG